MASWIQWPPRQEAFYQDLSDKGAPTKYETELYIGRSNVEIAPLI